VPPIRRPSPDEFAPYYQRYVERVPGDDLVAALEAQTPRTLAVLGAVPEARAGHRYGPGKWSVREVVGHVADAERVFAYRALRFARGDETPLATFDENAYVARGGFDARPLAEIADEFAAVRRATLALFRGLDAGAAGRGGTASGWGVTVRALGYIIAGHELHHLAVLAERYGVGAPA
jgi:hypothetical protein